MNRGASCAAVIRWHVVCVYFFLRARPYCILWPKASKVLVLEELLHIIVRHHLLIEDVRTSLGALYHTDHLGIGTSRGITCLQGCNRFLCHNL